MSLGRDFNRLWAAYAASTAGTWLAFDAFPLIAVLVLHADAAQVAMLSAAGLAAGALLAVPLGPWVEFRRKRPVMVAMDLLRCVVLLTVPVAYACGVLSLAHLVAVAVVMAAANIVFTAASGACLRTLVGPEDLVTANARFESTMWTATAVGPPAGGVAVGVLGPAVTVVLNAVSYALSALGIRAIRAPESPPPATRLSPREVAGGWRYILASPALRPLFLNTALVNGLVMATAPLLAVLLFRDLGFAPWQYGLAFGVPCLGGLVGSRLARPLVRRFGQHRVLVVSGAVRACWPVGLAFVPAGGAGVVVIVVVEFALITSMGVFNPVFAAYRLEHTAPARVARTLAAWSVTTGLTTAALTVLWGLLAELTSVRAALGLAGALVLVTPLLLVTVPTAVPRGSAS